MKTALRSGEHVIGLDIGGTKFMAAVVDHEYNVVARCKKKSHSKKENIPAEQRIYSVIRSAMEEAGIKKIAGIGVGSPGPLDPDTGVIIDTPNLKWKNFPLAQHLATEFEVPVVVDNDVNVGTYGEWSFGEVSDARDVLGMFPGTGIGGGVIIGGELLHGFSGAAGEVGHMTIQVDGPFCGCGKRGCLEAVASRVAIAKEVAALAFRGDAPYIAQECGTDLRKIRSGVLSRAIENGNEKVEDVVRKAAYLLGVGVSNLINVLSPEAVVLGGGLVEAMESLYLEEVQRAVWHHAMPYLREGVHIVAAKLGDDAVALGGARMVVERLGNGE